MTGPHWWWWWQWLGGSSDCVFFMFLIRFFSTPFFCTLLSYTHTVVVSVALCLIAAAPHSSLSPHLGAYRSIPLQCEKALYKSHHLIIILHKGLYDGQSEISCIKYFILQMLSQCCFCLNCIYIPISIMWIFVHPFRYKGCCIDAIMLLWYKVRV